MEERRETFVDRSRTTEAHSTVAASDLRTLPTRILAPAAGQEGRPYPLLVFAHGSGGLGTGYDRLLRTWAAASYTGDMDDPQAGLVTYASRDFLDHYLHGATDRLTRLQARANAPGVAKLDQER